jgi:hypothetical protein
LLSGCCAAIQYRKFDSRSSTRDVYLRHFPVRLLSRATSMGRSPAISAGDYSITSGLSEFVQRRRTQACLKAPYYIPKQSAMYSTCSPCCRDILLSGALTALESPRVVESHRRVVGHSHDDVSRIIRPMRHCCNNCFHYRPTSFHP